MRKIFLFFFFVFFLGFLSAASAAYEDELRDQIKKIETDYNRVPEMTYFRDMGIVARKAEEAELSELTSEIVRLKLLKVMEEYVRAELKKIHESYPAEPVASSRKLDDLSRYERFYEPAEEFLSTAYGQSIATDLSQLRQNSIGAFKRSCSDFAILTGIQALRKTGLFVTKNASEITQLREIQQQLTCCLGWKPEIHYFREEPFETEYEQGVLIEEGTLRLRSSRTDYSRAEWVGDWIYRYSGREGRGEGVSQGILNYHSGEDRATLAISASRVSSTGRMNFPAALSGEKRTVTIDGLTYNPQATLFAESFSLKGCRDKK
jgi:hypothetical protein